MQPPASLKALNDPIYEAFYGLTEQPFAITTDPRFFYLSASHQRAFSELLNGLKRREGVLMLTGETGIGKTTLCRAVLAALGDRTFSAIILNPYMTGAEVLRIVLRDFGLVSHEELRRGGLATADIPQLLDTLEGFLVSLVPLGSHAVIVLDEAQALTPVVLDQIRLLTGLEYRGQRLVQVVLCGQPGLLQTIKADTLLSLNERITRRVELTALPAEDIRGYIEHRLGVAGGAEAVRFDAAATQAVADLSRGLPRRVNVLCDRALQEGRIEGVGVITAELVKRAARALAGVHEPMHVIAAEPVRSLTSLFTRHTATPAAPPAPPPVTPPAPVIPVVEPPAAEAPAVIPEPPPATPAADVIVVAQAPAEVSEAVPEDVVTATAPEPAQDVFVVAPQDTVVEVAAEVPVENATAIIAAPTGEVTVTGPVETVSDAEPPAPPFEPATTLILGPRLTPKAPIPVVESRAPLSTPAPLDRTEPVAPLNKAEEVRPAWSAPPSDTMQDSEFLPEGGTARDADVRELSFGQEKAPESRIGRLVAAAAVVAILGGLGYAAWGWDARDPSIVIPSVPAAPAISRGVLPTALPATTREELQALYPVWRFATPAQPADPVVDTPPEAAFPSTEPDPTISFR